MTQNFPDNALYEMDNLEVLRGMNSQTVDLIATDPPFNIKRNRSGTAGQYVDNWKWGDTGILPDQWKWNEVHPKWLEEIKDNHTELYHAIDAAKHCQGEDTAAFLCFLSVRLIEMHRILKPTGSIYLHCDPTASHYIKMCMDAIFGRKNFKNEIVWRRSTAHNDPKKYGNNSDRLLYYSGGGKITWNGSTVAVPKTPEEIDKAYSLQDERGKYRTGDLTGPSHGYSGGESSQPWSGYDIRAKGRVWSAPLTGDYAKWIEDNLIPNYRSIKGVHDRLDILDSVGLIHHPQKGRSGWPGLKRYAEADSGNSVQSLFIDISGFTNYNKGNEWTGSPDQKPLALYERIIKASSNEGDLVLDPFCGCATTIIAADNLKRRWIGIDRRVDARYHIITRLMGIDKKERERIEKHATDKDWLERQTEKYEIHYQTDPPIRTDDETDQGNAPKLSHVYQHHLEPLHSHAEMHQFLVHQFGLKCWGCSFVPPDKRYLHLDHIVPKSDGGTNDIDNRSLLCQPCNSKKSNTMSLTSLRRQNKKDGYIQPGEAIDLQAALAWTRSLLVQTLRETPYQPPLPLESGG